MLIHFLHFCLSFSTNGIPSFAQTAGQPRKATFTTRHGMMMMMIKSTLGQAPRIHAQEKKRERCPLSADDARRTEMVSVYLGLRAEICAPGGLVNTRGESSFPLLSFTFHLFSSFSFSHSFSSFSFFPPLSQGISAHHHGSCHMSTIRGASSSHPIYIFVFRLPLTS